MTRLLDSDLRLRRICLLKPGEAGYPRSVRSKFIRKVGEDELARIIEEKVIKLLKRNDVSACILTQEEYEKRIMEKVKMK